VTTCHVRFEPGTESVQVPVGTLVLEAAQQAGLDLNVPCGGQGRCGRCAVVVEGGNVRRRSTVRLAAADLENGYALACQTVLEGDAQVRLLPQAKVERRLTTDRTAADIHIPLAYNPAVNQALVGVYLELDPPSLDDQTDDWSRLQTGLRRAGRAETVCAGLPLLRRLGGLLRAADWKITAILDIDTLHQPAGAARILELLPGDCRERLFGVALDIGTTSNVVYLVNLVSGAVVSRAVDYNGQVTRGEDVISRIIYAGKNAGKNDRESSGLAELQGLVLQTFNRLLQQAAQRARVQLNEIYKATVVGNSTMIHLFLGLPPQSIRLSPFVTTVNQPPLVQAAELGLQIHPQAAVDCLDGVASYVGSDISAGVVSAGLLDAAELTLFLDVGTNGEMVLGNRDWMLACACSAGPAFEGAGVEHGMRATTGAIEEVWINSTTYEPTYRVIGGGAPAGICGSGLIALVGELFVTGVIDRAGNLNHALPTARVREGEHGGEYVVAWAGETAGGRDIVLTKVDVDNLLRAKAAIYAGYTVLCASVGVDPAEVEQVLIGGAFGQYINIEKAIQIGLLPDLPWDRFQFLGNTAIKGAYMALLSREARGRVAAAAAKMTYLELSADNAFYHNFMSALFLPHTEIMRFPTVQAALENGLETGSLERKNGAAYEPAHRI
jgi:uncharacterized 2Fe-2S/4Fe-4S cluster protein (DUF4445 family)